MSFVVPQKQVGLLDLSRLLAVAKRQGLDAVRVDQDAVRLMLPLQRGRHCITGTIRDGWLNYDSDYTSRVDQQVVSRLLNGYAIQTFVDIWAKQGHQVTKMGNEATRVVAEVTIDDRKIRMVAADGKVTVEADGFTGNACVQEAERLFQSLGISTSDIQRKPEAGLLHRDNTTHLENGS